MDDVPVAHADTHMYDASVGILEEGKVVALDLASHASLHLGSTQSGLALHSTSAMVAQAYFNAACYLLRGVAWEPYSQRFKAYLCEPGAVDAARRTSTPKIGCVEEQSFGEVCGAVERDKLLVVNPSAIAVISALQEAPSLLVFNNFGSISQQQLVDHLGTVGSVGAHGYSR